MTFFGTTFIVHGDCGFRVPTTSNDMSGIIVRLAQKQTTKAPLNRVNEGFQVKYFGRLRYSSKNNMINYTAR